MPWSGRCPSNPKSIAEPLTQAQTVPARWYVDTDEAPWSGYDREYATARLPADRRIHYSHRTQMLNTSEHEAGVVEIRCGMSSRCGLTEHSFRSQATRFRSILQGIGTVPARPGPDSSVDADVSSLARHPSIDSPSEWRIARQLMTCGLPLGQAGATPWTSPDTFA